MLAFRVLFVQIVRPGERRALGAAKFVRVGNLGDARA
jgi:hypothetical protein